MSSDPIVDGVRIDSSINGERLGFSLRMNDINPNDIESIEVIRDPAAATLYGTEASNGVIRIITTQGVAGAPAFAVPVERGAMWLPEPTRLSGDVYGTLPCTEEVMNLNPYEEESGQRGASLSVRADPGGESLGPGWNGSPALRRLVRPLARKRVGIRGLEPGSADGREGLAAAGQMRWDEPYPQRLSPEASRTIRRSSGACPCRTSRR